MSDSEDIIASDEEHKEENNEDNSDEEEQNEENGQEDEESKNADESTEKTEDKIKDEHYSNNKPDEFSSENFKIELGGLPKYYPLGHLKKLLNTTLQLDAHRIKPGGMGRNVAYVNFKNEEMRTKAKLILNGYKWQNTPLTAIDADPAKDPMLLSKIDYLRVPKKEYENLPLEERITKACTPYHEMSYEDQIKEKDNVVKRVMRKFGNELASNNLDLRKFVRWHKIRRKGQICEMDDVVESPIKEGYRNKCEFTIGKNNDSEEPIVGFRVASYKEGSVEVGPIQHLRHISDTMKNVVKLMEAYVKESAHAAYDPFSHNGVWRQMTVRTTVNNDLMLVFVIHPQSLNEEEIGEIKDSLVSYFTTGDGAEAGVTSMFFQQYAQQESGKDVEFEHIWGKEYIEETILGKTFRASPDAFLQVNTQACELMYSKIAELLEVDMTTVVLDVCCGVGTIGLSLAESAYKVFGVELTPKAVESAKLNCESNGITNAVFYEGKAEDHIDNMLERAERVNTVAIVDPPRAGLSGSVMNALRKCEYLDKILYISCDPQAALPNFQALGRPRSKTYKGSYFVPIKATPIDLFPDTPHFELVILFERYDECKWDRIMAGNPRPKDQEYFDRVPELKYDPEEARKERDEKRKKNRNNRRDRDRDRGRDRDRNRNRYRYDRDGWGGRRSGDGGRRGWGGGRGGGGGRYDWEGSEGRGNRPPKRFREQYGAGFQEGFQAGLEALNSGQYPGFGQGGGWNMAQTQGGDFSSNEIPPATTGPGNWGPFRGNTDGAQQTNNTQVAGGVGMKDFGNTGYKTAQASTTNNSTMGQTGTTDYSSYQTGWSDGSNTGGMSSWGQMGASNNQMGAWSQQYQSFEEPGNKKWKSDNTTTTGYGNYGYGY